MFKIQLTVTNFYLLLNTICLFLFSLPCLDNKWRKLIAGREILRLGRFHNFNKRFRWLVSKNLLSYFANYLNYSVLDIVDVGRVTDPFGLLPKRRRNSHSPFMNVLQKVLNHLTVADSDIWPLLLFLFSSGVVFLAKEFKNLKQSYLPLISYCFKRRNRLVNSYIVPLTNVC